MDKLKFIKTIVFILTFLLIFGTLLMFAQIFKKNVLSPQAAASQAFLQEPIGSSIKQIYVDNNKLHILVSGGGQSDRIIILDNTSAQTISTIRLN